MKSKLKGRKRTLEQIERMRAARWGKTLKSRGEPVFGVAPDARIKDAITYLKHAQGAVDRDLMRNLIGLAIHTLKGTA